MRGEGLTYSILCEAMSAQDSDRDAQSAMEQAWQSAAMGGLKGLAVGTVAVTALHYAVQECFGKALQEERAWLWVVSTALASIRGAWRYGAHIASRPRSRQSHRASSHHDYHHCRFRRSGPCDRRSRSFS